MSQKIIFYGIHFEKDGEIINGNIAEFFDKLSTSMFGEQKKNTVRKVGEKYIRMFPFDYSADRKQIVIPFGKLKKTNIPYYLNEATDALEEVSMELFDVNALGYDKDYGVMLFTTNKEGPTFQNVEEYLNTCFKCSEGVKLQIKPIKYNTGIEKIRKAQLVRSLTIKLDLGKSLNNFYLSEMEENKSKPLISAVNKIATEAKDIGDSKTLSLTFGLGKNAKKADTLNLESTLELLNTLNINEDFVVEIEAKYANGTDEKVDLAKVKNSEKMLFYMGPSVNGQVSPTLLLESITNGVMARMSEILQYMRETKQSAINLGFSYKCVTNWTDKMDGEFYD